MAETEARERARQLFADAPFMVHLGAEVTDANAGFVEAYMPVQAWMKQQDGFVHAGIGTTLADHTMGTAAYTVIRPGYTPLSAEFSVRLLRPATGVQLRCCAEVLKAGRRLSVVTANVWSISAAGEESHVITAQATMAVVKRTAN